MDPPEIEPQDGYRSDDPFSGPAEMFEEPEEVERPVEIKKSAKGRKPIATEKPAEHDGGDSVDELLEGLSDTGALMDISQDYASESGSSTEGRGSDRVFETETLIPVLPIYQQQTAGLVGSGVDAGFYDSFEGSHGDEETEAKDGVDEEDDSGVAAAVVGGGEAAFEAAVADAAAVVAAGSVAAAAPVSGNDKDLTVTTGAAAPVEHMVSVASILDGDGGGSVPANVDGGAAVGQGVGLPGPGLQALYGIVPQLLVAPNEDLFNRLLVCFGPVCQSPFQ